MKQSKFSLTAPQLDFLERYRDLGFPDKSALVRRALDDLARRLEAQKLRE